MGITSGSLGSHDDYNAALYGRCAFRGTKSEMFASLRYDGGSRDGGILSPGAGLAVRVNKMVRVTMDTGRTFRLPSYTDLYYDSPANKGNPGLSSEKTSMVSTGVTLEKERGDVSISLFHRRSTDVIDWVRFRGETIWRTANHGRIMTNGIEMNARFRILQQSEGRLSAVFLDQSVQRKMGVESKYSLNPLVRTITASLTGAPAARFRYTVVARHENQMHGGSRTPVTVKLSCKTGPATAVLSVRNIFNERYEELPGLPAPGRWVMLNMEYGR